MSTNTGVPPHLWIDSAVAMNVNGVVSTSSPLSYAAGQQSQVQGVGPGGHPNTVRGAAELRGFALKRFYFAAEYEGARFERPRDGRVDFALQRSVLCGEVSQRYRHCYVSSQGAIESGAFWTYTAPHSGQVNGSARVPSLTPQAHTQPIRLAGLPTTRA